MKKIVPFTKEILFEGSLSEITSISLEHTLHVESDHLITGEFTVGGEYKKVDTSSHTDSFHYALPFDIHMDEHYILDHVLIDIHDFYYEIKDNKSLIINIEVSIDKLEEKLKEAKEERKVESIVEEIPVVTEEPVIPIFEEQSDYKEEETYSTYHVHIVREGDTLENIFTKYKVTKEEVELYNPLEELKIGDKIIIPSNEIK